jgi:hypothetical protein
MVSIPDVIVESEKVTTGFITVGTGGVGGVGAVGVQLYTNVKHNTKTRTFCNFRNFNIKRILN